MNFSATKGDLKIKIYRLEYTLLRMWLNSKWSQYGEEDSENKILL